MGKHPISSLRNVIFFSLSLYSLLRAYSLSFYLSLSPPYQFFFSHISHVSFLYSLPHMQCPLVLSTICVVSRPFCTCVALVVSQARIFRRFLHQLITSRDPKQYFPLIILLQYWHIHQFLILSSFPIHTHRYPIFFAIKSNQNIKL